jgi:signal transduction histidine kinase
MSTGRSIVLSYVRIFEALWLEAELVARLRETDAMQKDFVNVAAHELRTPITSMLMAASNARPASEGAEEVAMTRMQYDIILRNTRRLAGLVNDILDASRIENGTFALRKEPVDLMALAREAVVEARSQEAGIGDDNDNDYNSGRAKVVILREDSDKSGSSDSSSRGPVVRADPDRIRQVFVNLLTNAAKFTDGEGVEGGNGGRGTITISIRAEGDQAIASVSDTGSGIDKDMLPRLFQKFAAKSFKGIGLGLYICRWIVELHGGRIWAQNNPGGKGATFTFTLPVSGGATAAATTTSTAAANTPPATTMDAAKQQQQQQ